MKLLLARHGQSQGNEKGLVQGSLDPGLTARGQRQARALGKLLKSEHITASYASPLRRARETAELAGQSPTLEPALRESRMGKLEGMTHEQVEQTYPHLFEKFFGDPRYKMPEGESLLEVQKRVRPFLRMLYREHLDEVVFVAAHNTVNRVLLATLLDVPLNRCRVFKQKNACLNTLYLSNERAELYSLNSDLHYIR